MKVLVTGGAGFIGSAVVRQMIATTDWDIINVDLLTYAGHLDNLGSVVQSPRHHFVRADVADATAMAQVFKQYSPDKVLHLAAESHVDRSIDEPRAFIQTNIVGTFTLLETARRYWSALPAERLKAFRFHQVSTDEVFGTLGSAGRFSENSPYSPNSPYAATKASADHLLRAWHETFGLPTILTNCSNNYGPYHYPEKLIPLMILNALEEKPLPIYGSGSNVRDWLYVEDHARALILALSQGQVGESYTIGGQAERSNLEVVETLASILDKKKPRQNGRRYRELIHFVADRPGHDFRYAIDASKIKRDLGWQAQESFESGLDKTVSWYLEHQDWCLKVQDQYKRHRLGLDQRTINHES